MRILLGWAWTYLIVAEVVGTMSGITLFINQQARYRNFDNVYAAIGDDRHHRPVHRHVPRLARHGPVPVETHGRAPVRERSTVHGSRRTCVRKPRPVRAPSMPNPQTGTADQKSRKLQLTCRSVN